MRITSGMITSHYSRNLNNSLSQLNYYNIRAQTSRKFNKVSEDPVGASKAFSIRRAYSYNNDFTSNLKDTESMMLTAEGSVMKLTQIIEEISSSDLIGAINGTLGQDERSIIATKLDKMKDAIVSTLNTQYGDKYLFGGVSNSNPPFTVDAGGKLLYRGVDVDTIDNANPLVTEQNFIDLGLGLNFQNGVLDTQSAFDISLPGISFLGHGVDADGNTKNIYNLLTQLSDGLKSDNFSVDNIQPYIDNLNSQKQVVLTKLTEFGSKTNFLNYIEDKSTNLNLTYNESLKNIELVSPEQAIMDFKMQELAYMAALQMGTKIIQPSFLDYMR